LQLKPLLAVLGEYRVKSERFAFRRLLSQKNIDLGFSKTN